MQWSAEQAFDAERAESTTPLLTASGRNLGANNGDEESECCNDLHDLFIFSLTRKRRFRRSDEC